MNPGLVWTCAWYNIILAYLCAAESWFCPDKPQATQDLHQELSNKVYGQHIVLNTIPQIITQHSNKNDPKKALVISFHGVTGIGKTYVTELIAKYIYGEEGTKNQFVHIFNGADYIDIENIAEYQRELVLKVTEETQNCRRSMFIFNEVESIPFIFDILQPYLGDHTSIDKVDFRKTIFIFTSNIAGESIKLRTLQYLSKGIVRENIPQNEMEELITTSLVSGGSDKSLVDHFIPFLPLQPFHVKQCILQELLSRDNVSCGGNLLEIVDDVAEEIQFEKQSDGYSSFFISFFSEKQSNGIYFSSNGCKKLEKKIDAFL